MQFSKTDFCRRDRGSNQYTKKPKTHTVSQGNSTKSSKTNTLFQTTEKGKYDNTFYKASINHTDP